MTASRRFVNLTRQNLLSIENHRRVHKQFEMQSIIAIFVLAATSALTDAAGQNGVEEQLEYEEEIIQLRESNPEYDKLLKVLGILLSVNTTSESPEQVDKKLFDMLVLVHEIEYAWYLALTNTSTTSTETIESTPRGSTSMRMCSSMERDLLASNTSAEAFEVASKSMSPVLVPGDMVIVEESVGFRDVQVGDIIVFREPIPTEVESSAIISRVIEIINDPMEKLVLVTKGDANSGSVPGVDFPIYERDFIGMVDCLLKAGDID
jgi:signal peptidase I